jgi:uncharacterized protein
MKAFLSAEWRYLIMANYAFDAALLQPFLPAGTELDTFNGTHYVSLVGFLFDKTCLKGIPIPFHKRFEEVNLRFYVRRKENGVWKRGVVFIKEIVPKIAISLIANQLYGEHYQTMPMKHQWLIDDNTLQIKYFWKFGGRWQYIGVNAQNRSHAILAGSESEFITEHYWGYTRLSETTTSEYEVKHPTWRVFSVENCEISCSFEQLYGAAFKSLDSMKPISVLLAEGSAIQVMSGRKFTEKYMDKEIRKYVMDYFSNLLTENERLAMRHETLMSKKTSRNSAMLEAKGWLTVSQAVLDLLANGYDAFENAAVHRILTEQADKIFLNNCPKCQKLARTPYAKQCRCGHSWRETETK